jgi:hypothetical protein
VVCDMDRACRARAIASMIAPARQVDPQRRASVATSLNGPLRCLGNVGVPDNRRAA